MRGSLRAALRVAPAGLALALAVGAPGAAWSSGFALFEQAGRAAGLAGAFVAQADDPSAVFYNPAGLGFLGKADPVFTGGVSTRNQSELLYQGLVDQSGTTGSQESSILALPHVYAVIPLSDKARAGIGLYSPFWLDTEWEQPDSYPGRFVAQATRIRTYDLNSSVGYQVTPGFAVGAGAVIRSADFRMRQRQSPDLEFVSLQYDTAYAQGYGFTTGMLMRGARVSVGVTFQSAIEIDLEGTGTFTQIPTGDDALDEALRATRPFDVDLGFATTIEFPAVTTVGVAVALSDALTLEVDTQQIGWSSVDRLRLALPGEPEFNQTVVLDFDDSVALRTGLRLATSGGSEFRFGAAVAESPQPETTVGPFYADGDQTTVTLGWGKDWLDVAFVWTDVAQRRVVDNLDEINGNYSGNVWTLTISVSE